MRKFYLIILMLVVVPTGIIGQTQSFSEVMPEFPGGIEAFQKYLQDSIVYPRDAKVAGKEGTAYISFVVMKDGRIDSAKVVKGIPSAPELDAEALRVISRMPNWSPGTMNGRPVNVKMTVPIKFVLTGGKTKKKKKNR